MAVAADQRQQPARIGIVAAAGIEPEPARAFEARDAGRVRRRAQAAGLEPSMSSGAGMSVAQRSDQRRRDRLRRQLFHQLLRQARGPHPPARPARRGRRAAARDPWREFPRPSEAQIHSALDAGAAQHAFDPLAALIGDDQDRRALAARAAGAARAMLQRFGVARQLDVDDERD